MDIIPEPRDAVPEIRVPLAEPIVLPGSGADLEAGLAPLTSPDTPLRTATEFAAHLQSWLFFGLLIGALGDRFSLEDFITYTPNKPECRFLSLRNLDDLLREGLDTDGGWLSHFLQHAADTVREMEALGRLRESPAGETALLVLILIRRLDGFSDLRFVWSSSFLQKRMQDDGWCPQEIDWIMNHYDPTVACFLARLRRTRPVKHTECTETACVANNVQLDSGYRQRHVSDGCTCSTISVDADAVKAIIAQGRVPLVSVRHQGRGQISLKVTAASSLSSYTALSHVWSDGLGNPTANALHQCQLELISTSLSESLTKTEELGNYRTKGVHIDSIPKPSWTSFWGKGNLFWLDTLCIPVAAPGDPPDIVDQVKKLKFMAINQMGEIYAAAKQVLVLDSELQHTHADAEDEVSSIELLARLACSPWMRRCWTLQEGALATRVAFLSASGLVTPLVSGESHTWRDEISLFNAVSTEMLPGPHAYWWCVKFFRTAVEEARADEEAEAAARRAPVLSYLRRRFQDTLNEITCTLPRNVGGHNEFGMFCTVWNSLAYRNTTMKEDLPIIFANMLNINVFGILQTDSSKRMRELLQTLGRVPVGFLFNADPPVEVGMDSLYRWVPSAPSKTNMIQSQFHTLTWTEAGDLQFSYTYRDTPWFDRPDFMAVVFDGNTARQYGICSTFILPLSFDGEDDNFVELLVRLGHLEGDEMSRHHDCKEILIFEQRRLDDQTTTKRSRGCLLRLIDKEDQDMSESLKVTGQFDCSLTWTVASPEDLAHYPRIPPVRAWTSFDLTIRCNAERHIYRQRPFYGNWITISDFCTFLIMSVLCLIWYASIIIRIVIEVRLGWSNLSPLGRAATIIFAIEASGWLAYLVPPPLTQVLFVVDRFREAGGLERLDLIYVVLSLVGNLWLLVSWMWIARRCARAFIYKMWLRSFSDGWPEDGGWAWKTYFAVRDFYLRMQPWLDKLNGL